MEDIFIEAIRNKKKIYLTYYSKKDDTDNTRLCAPMDIAPHKGFPDRGVYYHVWDYEGSKGPHTAPIKAELISRIDVTDQEFDPSEFVTWQPDWTIDRDWGDYS